MSRPATATPLAERETVKLPEDARFLGYNRDVGFFRSESRGLVFVVQGDVIWALPAIAKKDDR